jgi:hypothetical protein
MRFSIRDILLFTVIAAVATGWALDRWRLVQRAADLERRSQRLLYEAEMSRAQALVERGAARLSFQQARALEQAQQLYTEVGAAETAANEAAIDAAK